VFFNSVYNALDPTRDRVKDFLHDKGFRPRVFAGGNLRTFFGGLAGVAKLISEEPEILLFAAAQWLVIWLAYLAWTQMLHWIPDEVWNALRHASKDEAKLQFTLINLVLLAWSFFVVCVASYPIGICNAAMVAVHDLRVSGEAVTIGKCLAVADRHLRRIWMFTVADAWITVGAILDRLPKKHGHRTLADELLYYAWKMATMAVVPALVNGRNFLAAGRDSFTLLTAQPLRAIGLRLGYSAVCWVIGVLAYAGCWITFRYFGTGVNGPHWLYNFYFLMAVPTFFAVGIVTVLVRPFFLLSVAKFYTDLIDVTAEVSEDLGHKAGEEPRVGSDAHAKTGISWTFALFVVLLAMLLADVFFAQQLGLLDWIKHLADKDLLSASQFQR
jgi:hypothetical protein